MVTQASRTALDVEAFDLAMEQFTAAFIRLASVAQLSFTTLGVLHTLATRGPMRLSELTGSERVTQPAMTQLVTRLERDGLAVRSPDPSDGRAVLVQVTEAGAAAVEARRRERVGRLADLAGRLDPRHRQALAAALPALHEAARLASEPTRQGTP
ncbi:MarR family transcriptional regulator [Amycolatopsis sp. OK19-0408]|uniref:MarR family transcriptional regulator n=1 Tax=Amycolatopsis iheyensis TaxID=2945988 RepID=A0A9X2SNR1_9PSEU|nr:MarR family transcriptional regulator [Amycolatopsis iheyensis]MCR6487361.1 MarR family transcriptional regulator [Amycolatopsis iheyensis]